MTQIYSSRPDFEAEITILSAEQGGPRTPPTNTTNWGIRYPEDIPFGDANFISPKFFDDDSKDLPKNHALSGTLNAEIHIADGDNIDRHKSRIRTGTKFYCIDRGRKVAVGRVTRVSGLKHR